ncbi:MAG: hypothetical protein PUC32_05320 [Oscillospiraceae bacterium]|nr:hypothetical protein [Oscillospiraceae bacterium]
MNLSRRCCPELLHLEDTLFWYLFGFLDYGEDLDDMIFYGQPYEISER